MIYSMKTTEIVWYMGCAILFRGVHDTSTLLCTERNNDVQETLLEYRDDRDFDGWC